MHNTESLSPVFKRVADPDPYGNVFVELLDPDPGVKIHSNFE
jgi:hypothetical protein